MVNSIQLFSFSPGSKFTFLLKDSIFRDMMSYGMLSRYDKISAFLTIALRSYVYKSKSIAPRLCHWLFPFWSDT